MSTFIIRQLRPVDPKHNTIRQQMARVNNIRQVNEKRASNRRRDVAIRNLAEAINNKRLV